MLKCTNPEVFGLKWIWQNITSNAPRKCSSIHPYLWPLPTGFLQVAAKRLRVLALRKVNHPIHAPAFPEGIIA